MGCNPKENQVRARRRLAGLWCFFSILSLFFSDAFAQETLRLIHADILKREQVGGKFEQRLEGNVKFQQGETFITCDLARQILDEDPYALIGHVSIEDEEQTLQADTVYVFEQDERQVATGNVISTRKDEVTQADRVTYFDAQNRVLSEGSVRVENMADNSILTGGVMEFWRDADHGKVTDSPVYVRFDSLETETTRIEADTMEFFDDGDRMTATSKVVVTQKNLAAYCSVAEYLKPDEVILLTGSPYVKQRNQTIKGDSLRIFFENSNVSQVTVRGNALVESEADTLSPGRWVNRLSGSYMEIFFVDEKVDRMEVENQAVSSYHLIEGDDYKGVNEISGDNIVLRFSDGDLNTVSVTSHPDVAVGKFSPPAR